MEQSFTDDAPLCLVFERHILTLHSVMELHDTATLPYAAHMHFNSGLGLNRFNLSMQITNAEEWERPLIGNFDNRCLTYAMK